MPREPREPDTDLQRGFEPLRTIFAVLVLLLGFAASARAHAGPAAMVASFTDGALIEGVVTCPSASTRGRGRRNFPAPTGDVR